MATREQGRLNAFMSFGKAAGWAATSAVSGVMLVTWGMKATAIVAAATAGIDIHFTNSFIRSEGEEY